MSDNSMNKLTEEQAQKAHELLMAEMEPAIQRGLDEVGKYVAGLAVGFVRDDAKKDAHKLVASALLGWAVLGATQFFKPDDVRTMVRSVLQDAAAKRGDIA